MTVKEEMRIMFVDRVANCTTRRIQIPSMASWGKKMSLLVIQGKMIWWIYPQMMMLPYILVFTIQRRTNIAKKFHEKFLFHIKNPLPSVAVPKSKRTNQGQFVYCNGKKSRKFYLQWLTINPQIVRKERIKSISHIFLHTWFDDWPGSQIVLQLTGRCPAVGHWNSRLLNPKLKMRRDTYSLIGLRSSIKLEVH